MTGTVDITIVNVPGQVEFASVGLELFGTLGGLEVAMASAEDIVLLPVLPVAVSVLFHGST